MSISLLDKNNVYKKTAEDTMSPTESHKSFKVSNDRRSEPSECLNLISTPSVMKLEHLDEPNDILDSMFKNEK